MKVSIVTATYNSKKYLQSCIDSVVAQDYPFIEYIIVDGASTDGTLELLENNKKQIDRWISEKDKGIYDAINKGIKIATGDIIGILNSDDFFADHQVVSRIVQAFKRTNSTIVYADIDFVSSDSFCRTVRHYSSKFFRPWMFRFGFQPAHPTFYTHRSNFEKYGYYLTSFKIAGDFELLLRFLHLHQLSYAYINDTWVKMRMGGASTKNIRSNILLNREISQACKLNSIPTTLFFIYLKYLVKWWGYAFKNRK